MEEWKSLISQLDGETETTKVIDLLDKLKPFVREREVKSKVLDILISFPDRLARIKATELLEELETADEEVVNALTQALLNDPDGFVRGFSAKALGKFGSIKAKDAVKRACEDPDGFVRHYANEALRVLEMKARLLSIIGEGRR